MPVENEPADINEFAKLYMEAIRQAGDTRQMVYDPEQSSIKVVDDIDKEMYLGNIFDEYCLFPKENQANALRRFVRAWFDSEKMIPDEFGDASHDLLPAIRSRFSFESEVVRAQIKNKKLSIPYQPLGETLAIGLVCDFPDTMKTIYQDHLDRWGVTFHEALEVARRNLCALPYRLEQGNGIYLTVTDDNYDAPRLLLLDWIRELRVNGDYVAMVPNRDTLIVTGSDDAKNIKRMVALAKEALQLPRPISGEALRLVGDEWVSWWPDSSHPSYRDFHNLFMQTYSDEYNWQKDVLDELYSARQENVCVAPFRAIHYPIITEFLFTATIWSKGVLNLLPDADVVCFEQIGRKSLLVDRECVIETVGHMMEPLNMYPPRWRVADFPTEQQMAAMKAKMNARLRGHRGG